MNTIRSFSGSYDFLSNFYPCRIRYNGFVFGSVEAAFQSAKCNSAAEQMHFVNLGPGAAKRMGNSILLRPDWENVKVRVMTECLRLKFGSASMLGQMLLDTLPADLIEGNTWHDNFWGDCVCRSCELIPGQNWLGRLLVIRRGELRV